MHLDNEDLSTYNLGTYYEHNTVLGAPKDTIKNPGHIFSVFL